jgi:hypothetical protein
LQTQKTVKGCERSSKKRFYKCIPFIRKREKILFSLLQLLEKQSIEGSFFEKFLQVQIERASTQSGRAFRWEDAIIHFAMSIQYYGGKAAIHLLRGKAFQGKKGELQNDPFDFNVYLPSISSLRSRIPPIDIYNQNINPYLKKIQTALQNSVAVGLIKFDEIEIRAGYFFDKHKNLVVGGTKGVSVKEAESFYKENMEKCTAKYVLQFAFTSLDGSFTTMLPFFPSTKASASFVQSIVSKVIEGFKSAGVEIFGSCSDGWSGCLKYVKKMKEHITGFVHFFDYVHVVKLMRKFFIK